MEQKNERNCKKTPKKSNPNDIIRDVDVEADFISGVNALEQKFYKILILVSLKMKQVRW